MSPFAKFMNACLPVAACGPLGAAPQVQHVEPLTKAANGAEIRSLLATSCGSCHSGAQAAGGLSLDSLAGSGQRREVRRRRGRRATRARARCSSASWRSDRAVRMPLGGTPLRAEQIATLKKMDRRRSGLACRSRDGNVAGDPEALVLRQARAAGCSVGEWHGAEPDRQLHSCAAAKGEAEVLAGSLEGNADPPGQPRPDRAAADDWKRSTRFSRTIGRMPMSGWWSGCWRRRITASDGRGPGSIWPVTPTPTDTRRIAAGPCGSTATG